MGSLVLPTSGRSIDVVQHRSDVKFADCGTLVVLQTYSAEGQLIDSKEARGAALHCDAITAGIQAGGMVGAAAVLRPSKTHINNENEQSQGQGQGQIQGQATTNTNVNHNSNRNSNRNSNSLHSSGSSGGGSSDHGNNGGGNGSSDGTNPGTGHHHDNGDNS